MAGVHGSSEAWILSGVSCRKDMSNLLFYVLLRLVREIELVVRVGRGRPVLGASAIQMEAMVCPVGTEGRQRAWRSGKNEWDWGEGAGGSMTPHRAAGAWTWWGEGSSGEQVGSFLKSCQAATLAPGRHSLQSICPHEDVAMSSYQPHRKQPRCPPAGERANNSAVDAARNENGPFVPPRERASKQDE